MGLIVSGFSGRPVQGGVGVKPVLIQDQDSGLYSSSPNEPSTWWTADELVEFEERGLITRLGKSRACETGDVAVYLHTGFVAPLAEADSSRLVRLSIDGLLLEPDCECYVGILQWDRAMERLAIWSKDLLAAAKSALAADEPSHSVRAHTALQEAMRARYASAGHPELSEMRRVAFQVAWASQRVLGMETDALCGDAALEFTQDELRHMKQQAVRLWMTSPPDRPRCRQREWQDNILGHTPHTIAEARA